MWISWKWSKDEPLIGNVSYDEDEDEADERESGLPDDFI
jgi:hypothetical protein